MSHDDQLAALVRDAVSEVDPPDRLSEIRARTAAGRPGRRWWVVAGGATLATAATVAVVAALGTGPAPTVTPEPAPADPPVGQTGGRAVAAYFVGDTPAGPRLYREFQPVVSPVPGLAGLALLESGATDPDYRSLWPAGSFELDRISDPEAGGVHVFLTDEAPAPSPLAEQQVVYTVSAGFQEPLWVVFHRGGVQSEPVTAAPQLEVLAKVSLSDPAEGLTVADTLTVAGRANSFEANLLWTVEQSGAAVDRGTFMAEGYMGEHLFPFSGEIDVSSLDPGRYTLIVETDDPSGGTEGTGPHTDTRTFVIE